MSDADKSPREPYTIIATPKSEYDALVNERDKLQQELEAAEALLQKCFNSSYAIFSVDDESGQEISSYGYIPTKEISEYFNKHSKG